MSIKLPSIFILDENGEQTEKLRPDVANQVNEAVTHNGLNAFCDLWSVPPNQRDPATGLPLFRQQPNPDKIKRLPVFTPILEQPMPDGWYWQDHKSFGWAAFYIRDANCVETHYVRESGFCVNYYSGTIYGPFHFNFSEVS